LQRLGSNSLKQSQVAHLIALTSSTFPLQMQTRLYGIEKAQNKRMESNG
jgi:hypothetical protein